VEELRRTVAKLAEHERRLREQLELERASHEADVSRLEAELDAQGDRLAESQRRVAELRERLAARRGRRGRSLRNRVAGLRG
jgi:septal ring factor EnvC (AmiA/AmiB activator)